uniref:Myosin motor domain-containing protein n=1 Tax=Plectus sambesii TaxID=2011161 RepID=A0A914XTZ0_9BILA
MAPKKPSANEETAKLRLEFTAAMEDIPNDWIRLNELLSSSRHLNVAVVSNPEEAEEWKFLRPPNVKTNVLDQLTDDLSGTSVWIPDATEGFVSAVLIKRGETTSEVHRNKKKLMIKSDLVLDANPSVFDCCEDMALMTNLNEATVLHNLRTRFKQNLIHTYSGLFCITINPWRWLPIYSPKIVFLYRGQPLNTMPPHIYSVADGVYSQMIEGQRNQSILITGESGSGKTENTKKLVQYFTVVAGMRTKPGTSSLEDQIIESNPILEAYGNAKNGINDNSSRFGKFIKIYFNGSGKVSKAEVESYLLEKSRVVSQSKDERSFHIFYELLAAKKELKDSLHLRGGPKDYKFLQNGMASIDGVDDGIEMELTEHALKTLGFSAAEQVNLMKMTAACLIIGEIRFRAQSRLNDQAMVENFDAPDNVCSLLGIESMAFVDALTQPMVFVNGEWVKQARGVVQVNASAQSVAKSVYEKLFRWLVKRCNVSLGSKATKKLRVPEAFIGILDIAGFEIFLLNSFEQLCINYTNEKLQQFFNHTMFVQEQDEYEAEGLDWEYINFALDLKPAIDLIEQPMGIMSILEEECIAPKATDERFAQKLLERHGGKSLKFGKPTKSVKGASTTKAVAHFSIEHYAGFVNYNADGWIEKCKDPLNPAVVKLFQAAKNEVLREIWKQYGTNGLKSETSTGSKTRNRRAQSMAFMTVSGLYRDQLAKLLSTLGQTSPHFVRCIVPNYERKPGYLNAPLVMNQLRCNGVLEGIRICRKGYPNRLLYEEVKERYRIIAPGRINLTSDPKAATIAICETARLQNVQDYQLGLTKIFFKVGVIARLEKLRTEKLGELMLMLQANIRWYLAKLQMQRIKDIREPTLLIQRNVRKWINMRQWPWFKLMKMVGPMAREGIESVKLKSEAVEQEKKQLSSELEAMRRLHQEIASKYENELADHIGRMQMADTEKEKAEQRIAGLIMMLNEKDAILSELRTENEQLRSALEEIEQRKKNSNDVAVEANLISASDIEELTSKVAQKEAECSELEKRLRESETARRESEKMNMQMNELFSKLIEHTRGAEDVLKSDVSSSGSFSAALLKGDRELEELNATTAQIDTTSDLSNQKICASMAAQTKSLFTTINDKLVELHGLYEKLATFAEYVELLEARKMQIEAQASELAAKVERLAADLTAQLEKNQQLLLSNSRTVDAMELRISELQEKLTRVESILNTKASKRGSILELPKATLEEPKTLTDHSKRIDDLTTLADQLIGKAVDRHNDIQTLLIRVSNAEKENEKLQALFEGRITTIASYSGEVDRLKKSLSEERESRNRMQNDIDDLSTRAKLLGEKILQHDADIALKERKISDLDDQLNQSRKQQDKMADQIRKNQQNMREMAFNFNELQKNSEEKSFEFRQLETQHRSVQDEYEKLLNIIRELKAKIVALEDELNTEKAERKMAEKALNAISKEMAAKIEELRCTEEKLEEQIEINKQKDIELQRRQDELDMLKLEHEKELTEMKDRYAQSLTLYQDKLDNLHRKSLKLETENQTIKAQLYNENVEAEMEGRRQTRMNTVQVAKLSDEYQSGSLPRKFFSGIGIAARQMEELEREKQDLLAEKRLMKREMDDYEKIIQGEYKKNERLDKANRQLKSENALLLQEAKNKASVMADLTKKIRLLEAGISQQKDTMGKLLEEETEADADRYRHHSLTRTGSNDSRSSLLGLSSFDRRRNDFERMNRPASLMYKRTAGSYDE